MNALADCGELIYNKLGLFKAERLTWSLIAIVIFIIYVAYTIINISKFIVFLAFILFV